jgi:hydrogenase maturation protein HypF
MDQRRSLEVFRTVQHSLQTLYGVTAQAILCDAHPGYITHRWARTTGLPVVRIPHHHAPASALAGEHPEAQGDWLTFTWDGVGMGEDGTLWGGEALLGRPGRWRRVARLRPCAGRSGTTCPMRQWGRTWPGTPGSVASIPTKPPPRGGLSMPPPTS